MSMTDEETRAFDTLRAACEAAGIRTHGFGDLHTDHARRAVLYEAQQIRGRLRTPRPYLTDAQGDIRGKNIDDMDASDIVWACTVDAAAEDVPGYDPEHYSAEDWARELTEADMKALMSHKDGHD